jgi:hypothetical protein
MENRARRRNGNGANLTSTWGEVAALEGDGNATMYLYDALVDHEDPSEGFRIPTISDVQVGDKVKVWIDKERGERWIDPSSAYASVSLPDPLTVDTLNVNTAVALDDDVAITWEADTNLYRGAANQVKTDDEVVIANAGGKDTLALTSTGTDTGITIGADVTLFRSAADLLKTDDEFEVGAAGGKDTLRLTSTGTDTGLTIGGDVTLFRSSANLLKTDDEFEIGIGGGKDTLRLTSTSADTGVTFGGDTNLYRSAANLLKTDDSLETAGTYFKHTGFLRHGGTSFPGSPSTGDRYWRTDLEMEFFYDGTRWLSTTLHNITIALHNVTDVKQNFSATTSAANRGPAPALSGGSDIWLEEWIVGFTVTGGTALGASHKWVGDLIAIQDGTASTTSIEFVNIDSGSSGVFRRSVVTIAALMNNGTAHDLLQVNWTKTGTPGTLQGYHEVTYRIVAT